MVTPNGNFHVKPSRKNPNLHHFSHNFFLPWTLVRYTKVTEKSKISSPGKFRNPNFQSFIIGSLDQKMTVTMQKWGLPYVS